MATIMRVGGGAGGGLVFTVVGGTTLPSNPSENTVWVNTSTAINNVYAQVYAPANPVAGDVWINTSVTLDSDGNPIIVDDYHLTISESPFIRISAKSGHQWNGSEWVGLKLRVYKNGAWTSDALIILMDGEWGHLGAPTVYYKGDDKQSSMSKVYYTYSDKYLRIYTTTTGSSSSRSDKLFIETPIAVDSYNNLTAVGYTTDSIYGRVFLHSEIKSVSGSSADYITDYIRTATAEEPTTVTVDISSATGQMYLGIMLGVLASSKIPSCSFREIVLTN